MTIHNKLKRTISASSEFELLEKVSELTTRGCANVGVDCEIPHQFERGRNIPFKGVETSP